MTTAKHPRTLASDDADAIVEEFSGANDYVVVGSESLLELRAASAARREAEARIEAAVLSARRDGASWSVIGAQLGMTRQGARQRFEQLSTS